jgi:hypothetical protein
VSVFVAQRDLLARSRGSLARATAAVNALPVRRVLAVFIAVELLAVLATALVVRHAGWIYYQGGDQLWLYTSGWLLAHGHLTQTQVGYGWPVLMAPIARIAGPNLVRAFPALVLIDVLVLVPVAMLALYGIAVRIAGRIFAYWTLLLWIVVPFVGVLYTNQGYHQKYTELTLPQSFGLTAMADMPTMVAALVSAYFCAKVLFDNEPQLVDAVASGVAAGVAIGIKPATVLFLVGPVLALLYRRRVLQLAVIGAATLPAVAALAVWKDRGLGSLPIISNSAPGGVASAGPIGGIGFGKYVHTLNWSKFLNNLDLLREHFWSGRLIEWLLLAGLIALARRSITAALLVGGWFFSFAIVKGTFVGASIEDASLLRLMIPAFPAFILLLASLPFLLPGVPARAAAVSQPLRGPSLRTRWILIGVTVLVSAVIPLGAFAAASTGAGIDVARVGTTAMPIPANIDIGLGASVQGGRVVLTWRSQSSFGGPVFYRVWRLRHDGLTCPPVPGGRVCDLKMPEVGTTHATSFTDRAPSGRWTYRVAVAANWLNDPAYGDPYEVSRAVAVTVP